MLKSPGSYRIRGITFLFWATDSFGEGGCLWGKTDRRDSSQAEMADLQSTLGRSLMAIPHNSKCRYGERGAAAARPKAQIILDAAKVSAASGGCSEPKQGQRSQSARGFCPRSTMRVPQPDIIEHFGNADAVPQPPERCLSREAGIMRCCPKNNGAIHMDHTARLEYQCSVVTCGGTNRCPPVQNPSASPNAGANAGTVPKSR